MRKKIKQLAYGIFESKEQEISFSTEQLSLEVIEGKDVQGEFTISGNGHKVRGIVYTTCSRMECLTPQFEGEEIRIRYQFHSDGLIEGDKREGAFVLVCDKGEYNLPFLVSISKKYAQTSIGVIKTLDDFTRLAKESFAESYQVFYSMNFSNIIKESDEKASLLYELIRKETPSMQAVEAFLVGIGRKNSVKIVLEKEAVSFSEILTSQKEQLCLKQEEWGYICADVMSDTDFIRLEKNNITSEDFLGNTCFVPYYIDVDAMHAGKNFGRIIFELQGQKLVCEICAVKASTENQEENAGTVTPHQIELQNRTALMQLYIDYRLKKIVTGVWAKESIGLLEQLIENDSDCDLYCLMKAQAFLVNRQRQEANWILEEYKRKTQDRKTPEWGYYLYLCTLMEREESYVNQIAEQIEELFHSYPENSLLFWIRLFIREDYYVDNDRRLKAIKRWIEAGHDSPYFYLEAYYLYMQDPYLLTKLDSFELRILNWARKQNAISKDVAMQILHLVSTEIHYDEKIYALLLACYELGETEENVTAICSYLIKGQRFEKEYHKWYALGIEYEARITNLYEAYLLSADEENLAPIPKVVLMYFQYHNTLSYKQLALLYAYIIKNREKAKDVYAKYRRTIEQFAMSQIEAGHIDENLAVIYREMLPLGILNRELAEKLSKVLFVHKLTIDEKEQKRTFVRVMIAQKQWKQISYVPIVDGVAYFSVYTKDYCIFLQDAKGLLYTDAGYYKEHTLLEADLYLEMVKSLAPCTIPYLIHTYEKKMELSTKDEAGVAAILSSCDIKDEWKMGVLVAYIRSLAGKEFSSQAEDYLRNANYRLMSVKDRSFMIEQLIENHFYEQAYEMMQLYGYDTIGSAYRVAVCSNRIMADNFEEDEFLTGLAADTFLSGKYNDVLLIYLCKYYNGTAANMVKLWEALGQFEIDTYDLEERIVSQMLYTGKVTDKIGDIYESYCQGGGREQVCMAYLTWFSHQYIVKNVAIPKHVIEQNERRLLLHQEVNDVQKFAVLKYYSGMEHLSDSQYKMADALLLECTTRGICFGFYMKFDSRLKDKYQLYDKFYIEHFLKPGLTVRIYYCINDGKVCEEELKEVYDGVYVKELILFFGDKVSYYIIQPNGKPEQAPLAADQIENSGVYANQGENRYAMLNSMLFNVALQEKEALKKEMLEYQKKMISTEAVFKML